MHPQISALMCVADGVSRMSEMVWDNRFRYINEFQKMGPMISVSDRTASFNGNQKLSGEPVVSTDLRAGAALIILALRAQGTSQISKISLIERGYDNIVGKLAALGADIKRVDE
jgi:UDP-N-acetylglucosamine 1-carboxyvinyltransferase